jgi:hypothetical protein
MQPLFRVFLLSLLLIAGAATAFAQELTRQPLAKPKELPGLFTLVLIGEAGGSSDAERVALLDPEGDAFTFRPVAPEYRVKTLVGLTAAAALSEAEKFFAGHCAYNGYRVKNLLLSTGASVGVELVPDYPVALCEYGNEVTVSYIVGDDGEIKVYTSLLLPVGDGLPFGKSGLRNKP